ncbi:hypothetical protein Gasu2_10620 [Galdieria sulphuraria]|nr:hypothetical protein Gasu2_10620 [Galdieria sulphuraria]
MLSSIQRSIFGSPENSRPSLYHPHYRRPDEAALEPGAVRASSEFRLAFRELIREFADIAVREAVKVRRSVASVHETIRRSISSRRGSIFSPRTSTGSEYELLEENSEFGSILESKDSVELGETLDIYRLDIIAEEKDLVALDPRKPYLRERVSWLQSVRHVYFHIPGLHDIHCNLSEPSDNDSTFVEGENSVMELGDNMDEPSTPLQSGYRTSPFVVIHDIEGVAGYVTYLKFSINGRMNEWRSNMFRKRIFSVDLKNLRQRAQSLPPIRRRSKQLSNAGYYERERMHSERFPSETSSRPSQVMRIRRRLFRPWYYKLKSFPMWVGIMFLVGSIIFTIGLIGWPFFVGSIFYTVGAYIRILEVLNAPPVHPMISDEDSVRLSVDILEHRKIRLFGWEPWRWDFLGALIQQIGACLYNINCFVGNGNSAFNLSFYETQFILWLPDTLGSICFVVSSYFFIVEYGHRWWTWDPKSLLYWTVLCNFMGAIGFLLNGAFGFGEYAFPSNSLYVYIGSDLPLLFGCICFSLGGLFLILEQSLPSHLDILASFGHLFSE